MANIFIFSRWANFTLTIDKVDTYLGKGEDDFGKVNDDLGKVDSDIG